MLDCLKTIIQKGLCQHILHAIYEVDLSSNVISPLLQYIPLAARREVLMDPLSDEIDSLRVPLSEFGGTRIFLLNTFVICGGCLFECFFLKPRLKSSVVHPHVLSLYLVSHG